MLPSRRVECKSEDNKKSLETEVVKSSQLVELM